MNLTLKTLGAMMRGPLVLFKEVDSPLSPERMIAMVKSGYSVEEVNQINYRNKLDAFLKNERLSYGFILFFLIVPLAHISLIGLFPLVLTSVAGLQR